MSINKVINLRLILFTINVYLLANPRVDKYSIFFSGSVAKLSHTKKSRLKMSRIIIMKDNLNKKKLQMKNRLCIFLLILD